jgi:hypothetical protein
MWYGQDSGQPDIGYVLVVFLWPQERLKRSVFRQAERQQLKKWRERLSALWEHMSGINICVSEKDLSDAKKQYIRKFYDKENPEFDVKGLGLKLQVSERTVRRALATTDEKDERQQNLL